MHFLGLTTALLMLAPIAGTAPDQTAATEVLSTWDRARSAAYADGDREALADLYLPGAGREDLAVLDDYRRRGFTVWLRSQVFAAVLVRSTESTIDLRVTDRTITVIGDGVRCRALPTTLPATRELAFVRVGDRWQIRSVRAVPPAGLR